MAQLSLTYELNEPATVTETIDGEAVIINLEKGVYFSIRGTGLDIWTHVLGGASLDEMIVGLTARHPSEASRIPADVSAFVDRLVEEDLVRIAARPIRTRLAAVELAANVNYDVPSLEKYTDMEALLLLDPIHDVDESGWPKRAQHE